jgi:Stress responsive A/B Barrel Domain
MIRHTAVFRLKHTPGSEAETKFLDEIRKLQVIAGVENFELLRQVSPKSDYTFCISMTFADDVAYEGYNTHPDHVAFVKTRWLPEVAAFTELDYVTLG